MTIEKTRVKVCGLRRRLDVEACVDLGVDMLGFNCWPGSPRYVAPTELGPLVSGVPERIEIVLVFVHAEPEAVRRVLEPLDVPATRVAVQLHGDEDPARYAHLAARVIQVLRIGEARIPEVRASRVLLDVHAAAFGGTGERIDPGAVFALVPTLPREWMLAGGLDAMNVGEAIRGFHPWGVDVASGVEVTPGVKDHDKLAAFVASVHEAGSETERERRSETC